MSSLSAIILNPFETYTSEMAYSMVSCLGLYLAKKLKKLNSNQEEQLKSTKQKLITTLDRWYYANTISEYNTLINSTYEKTEPFKILKMMLEKEVIPDVDTYNALLLNCYQNDNFNDATLLKKEILDETGPVVPNSYTLNILIKGLNKKYLSLKSKNKSLYEKQALNKKFEEHTDTSDNSAGSDSSDNEHKQKNKINMYKSDLELNNMFDDELVEIIQTLENLEVYMDVFTQNSILEALVEQKRLEEAWNQYINMKKFFNPDYSTFKTMLRGIKICKSSKDKNELWLERTITILNETKDSYELEEGFLNTLLETLVKLKSFDKSEILFEEMKMLNNNKSEVQKELITELTYAIMITAFGKKLELNKASQVFDELKLNQKVQSTCLSYCKMVKACIDCKDIDLAEKYFNDMEVQTAEITSASTSASSNPIERNIQLYILLLNGYRVQKNITKALQLYNKLKAEKHIIINSTFYNSLIDLCLDTGNTDKIAEIYLDFKYTSNEEDESSQPNLKTYIMLLKGYSKLNNFSKVQDIVCYLKRRQDYIFTEDIYEIIFNCYINNGEENAIKTIWEEMKKSQMKLGERFYGQLIKYYCKIGNFNRAFEFFEECIKIGIKPGCSIYYEIIRSQIKANFIDRAITLFRNMLLKKVSGDKLIFELIINACVKFERSEEALEFLINAIKSNIKPDEDIASQALAAYVNNDELKPYERKEGLNKYYIAIDDSNQDLEILEFTIHELTKFFARKNMFIFDEKFLNDNNCYKENNYNNTNTGNNGYNGYNGNNTNKNSLYSAQNPLKLNANSYIPKSESNNNQSTPLNAKNTYNAKVGLSNNNSLYDTTKILNTKNIQSNSLSNNDFNNFSNVGFSRSKSNLYDSHLVINNNNSTDLYNQKSHEMPKTNPIIKENKVEEVSFNKNKNFKSSAIVEEQVSAFDAYQSNKVVGNKNKNNNNNNNYNKNNNNNNNNNNNYNNNYYDGNYVEGNNSYNYSNQSNYGSKNYYESNINYNKTPQAKTKQWGGSNFYASNY